MCGIVGQVSLAGIPPIVERLAEAAARMKNRGPDDSGMWSEGPVALAHRRLAILDISAAGHQPMHSPDGRFVIVFNGEVYNFLELRRELDPDESHWGSRSDTEVVLAAYARWGVGCLSRFRGMFAFAIWDRLEQRLFAARDRMGVKPFYYHADARDFLFASRPRALFALKPELNSEIDNQALRFYLEIGYIPAPWSFHPGIRKLPPAHYLLLDRDGLKIERYWDFRHIEPRHDWANRSEDDLLDELDEIVTRCVLLRMISDVPLGAFLSGGIDSSLVVAVMARHANRPVKTFTIGFDESVYDESSHAARVAAHLGTDHYTEHLRVDGLLNLLPSFFDEYDEPFFDYSAFPTMAVSRAARRHVTVSLSGDGGDELFGGYHYYRIAHQLEPFFRIPRPLRMVMAGLARSVPSHKMKLLGAALARPDVSSAFGFARSITKDFSGVFDPKMLGDTISIGELFHDASASFPGGLKGAERGMRLDAGYTLPDDYLQKVDVASMAFSLESREPLLDHELVEWAMRLPLKWKLRGRTTKYLLRRLVYRYVPQSIVDRPKQGFGVPIDSWLRGPLKEWSEARLNDFRLFEGLPISQGGIQRLYRLHLSGTRNAHPQLWAVLMLLEYVERQRS